LDTILRADPREYEALVMDTQGSELLVLKGAKSVIPNFRYIKTEAADFEMYRGGAKADELVKFLADFGFSVVRRELIARKSDGAGECFDLLFKRRK
jgi:hypothetical protein